MFKPRICSRCLLKTIRAYDAPRRHIQTRFYGLREEQQAPPARGLGLVGPSAKEQERPIDEVRLTGDQLSSWVRRPMPQTTPSPFRTSQSDFMNQDVFRDIFQRLDLPSGLLCDHVFPLLKAQQGSQHDRLTTGVSRNIFKRWANRQLLDPSNPRSDWRFLLRQLSQSYEGEPIHRIADIQKFSTKKRTSQPSLLHGFDEHGFPLYPTKASRLSLRSYLRRLATCRPTQRFYVEKRRLKEDGQNTNWTGLAPYVADEIERVLYNPLLREFVTEVACQIAFDYFFAHAMLDRARNLYLRIEYLQIPIGLDTFNSILQGFAVQKDLVNFSLVHDTMTRKGIKPDAFTWAKLLRAIYAADGRQQVARTMQHLGLTNNPPIRRAVDNLTIRNELYEHRGRHPDNTHYMYERDQDDRGPLWLTNVMGHEIIHDTLRSEGRFASDRLLEAIILFSGFKQREVRPLASTVRLIFIHCNTRPKLALAAAVIAMAQQHWNMTPNLKAMKALFEQAWCTGSLCFLRAIWVASSLEGTLSLKHLANVRESILANARRSQQEAESVSPLSFMDLAGSFAVGLDLLNPLGLERSGAASLPRAKPAEPSSELMTVESHPETGPPPSIKWKDLPGWEEFRAQNVQTVAKILDGHLLRAEAGQSIAPDLAQMLLEAWKQDDHLDSQNFWHAKRSEQLAMLDQIPVLNATLVKQYPRTSQFA